MSLLLSCQSCDISFGTSVNSFVDHMTDSHSDERVCCANCGEILSSGFEYASHFIQNHHGSSLAVCESQSFSCPMCPFQCSDSELLGVHFQAVHQEEEQNSQDDSESKLTCFLCGTQTESENALQEHVNFCLDSANPATDRSLLMNQETESGNLVCFLCGMAADSQQDLQNHVETHLDASSTSYHQSVATKDPDHSLAISLQAEEKQKRSEEERVEFQKLRAQNGMDERGSYRSQGRDALDRRYYNGQIDLEQYYAGLNGLGIQEQHGIEDPSFPVEGLLDSIKKFSAFDHDVVELKTCANVEHCGSQAADAGFGCGYRNIQMILTGLKHEEPFKRLLWKDTATDLPSVPKIQQLIEAAWEKGFDRVGAEQLRWKLRGTRKWIGATECAAFLSCFRIRVGIMDFHKSTGPGGTHPELFKWIWNYFSSASPPFPLYLQHQGHSRTLIGIERTKREDRLLILDPGHRRGRLLDLNRASPSNHNEACKVLKFLRRTVGEMRSPQYQIVVPEGVIETDEEFEDTKQNPKVEKIPQ